MGNANGTALDFLAEHLAQVDEHMIDVLEGAHALEQDLQELVNATSWYTHLELADLAEIHGYLELSRRCVLMVSGYIGIARALQENTTIPDPAEVVRTARAALGLPPERE